MENKPHPHRVILSSEMKEECVINQTIKMEGCDGFLETALLNIFITIYERQPHLFLNVMDKFIEETLNK